MSLFTKLVRGASVNVLEHGLKVVAMFVTTPLMIRYLGNEDYGTWLLAIAIIAYFRLLDLGFSFAGSRFLGNALGADDRKEYRSLTSKLFRLYARIGMAAFVLTLLIVWVLPLFIEDAAMVYTVRLLVAGFGIVTALRFFTRIFEVILKSHVRYDLIGISSIFKTMLQAGFVIGLLLAGYGLIPLLVAHMLIDAIDQLLLVFLSRRVEAKPHLRGVCDGKVQTGELLRYSATAMATNAGNALRQGIDPLLITHVSGVAALPAYNIGVRFLSVFTDVINAIFGGNFLAAFSQLHGRGDAGALNERFLQALRYSAVVATLGGCGLMMFGPAFIARWVGSDFAVSGSVLWILAPVTTLCLCQYPVGNLFYSQNKQHWLVAMTLVGGFFNLALSFYLAWRIGWIGVVWATCVEMALVYGLGIPLLVNRVCAIPFKRYFLQMFVPATQVSLVSGVYWLMVQPYVVSTFNRLLVLGSGYMAIISTAIWFLVFTKSERSQLLKAVKPARA